MQSTDRNDWQTLFNQEVRLAEVKQYQLISGHPNLQHTNEIITYLNMKSATQ